MIVKLSDSPPPASSRREDDCPFPHAPAIETEHVPCGLCGSDDSDPFAEGFDYEYQTCRNRWTFVRCQKCSNVYLDPRPVWSALSTIYPPNYYAYNYDKQVGWFAQTAKEWLDRRRFAALRRSIAGEIRYYLDIGCGNGRYLKAMAASGLPREHVFGIELDHAVANRLSAEGFQVLTCPFEEAHDLPPGKFQLITLFSVLEHVSSPRETLRKAYDLLAPGGLLVFEVPNINSLNARLFRRRYWGGYHTPRHWNIFSIEAIQSISDPMGYHLKNVRRTTGHAFWLWSLHHLFRYEYGWDRVGKWFNPCRCLLGLLIATPFDMIRGRLGCQTDNMIVSLQK